MTFEHIYNILSPQEVDHNTLSPTNQGVKVMYDNVKNINKLRSSVLMN